MEELGNPYLASETKPDSKSTQRVFTVLRFPFGRVGPLLWGAVAVATIALVDLLDRIHHFARFFILISTETLLVMIFMMVLGIFYGLYYGITLAIICRILNCRPKAKLHFWVVMCTNLIATLTLFELDQFWSRYYTPPLILLAPLIGSIAGILSTCAWNQPREIHHTSNPLCIVSYDEVS